MTTLQPRNRNQNRCGKVGYKQQRRKERGFSMVAFSNYATRSIPIAVTKDGTKELNMCVLVVHCHSSYNNNQ